MGKVHQKTEGDSPEPPCLVRGAAEWLQLLFIVKGYKGDALAGIRRLLAAHCVFHSDCERCQAHLALEYQDPTRRSTHGQA